MPDEYQKQINKMGEALLKAINGVTQIAKIHMDNNRMLLNAVRNFVHMITKVGRDNNEISIHLSDGRFYCQEQQLILRPKNAKLFNRMVRFFEDRAIIGLNIKADLKETDLKRIILFFRLADQSAKHEDPSGWLAERLRENDIVWITPAQTPIKETGADSPSPDELAVRKAKVRKSYANVLSSIRETAHKLSAKKGVGFRNSVRLVQNMVDLIEQDESLFLGISTIRIYDDYTYAHSLNVAILAMCLGKHIGLNHIMLERLGLCGLFHDLGKIEIPKEVLNKKGALSDEEYDLIKTHSMHSARLILRIKAASDRKNKILVPPFEHHMGYDRSGYPDAKTGRRISLFGRILTIADVYDAITSPRVYRKEAMSPDKALAQMISQSGTHFDPVLLKVFIRMLGAYPTGTLVKLDNGEMGIVTSYSNNVDHDRPVLQLLVKDAEKKYKKGAVVDLSQRDSETGRYDYTIVRTMHPSTIGVQAAAFIV